MTPAPLAVPLFLWPTPLDRKRLARWQRAAVRHAYRLPPEVTLAREVRS